jgi:hypothetical protein
MAFSFHDRGGAPTSNRRTAALSMVALVRLSAGCVYRPVTFSTISRACVLNEKGNFLKETVAARLKAEQVHKLHFSKQIFRWGGTRTSQLPATTPKFCRMG